MFTVSQLIAAESWTTLGLEQTLSGPDPWSVLHNNRQPAEGSLTVVLGWRCTELIRRWVWFPCIGCGLSQLWGGRDACCSHIFFLPSDTFFFLSTSRKAYIDPRSSRNLLNIPHTGQLSRPLEKCPQGSRLLFCLSMSDSTFYKTPFILSPNTLSGGCHLFLYTSISKGTSSSNPRKID